MEDVDKGEMFNLSDPHNNNRIAFDYPEPVVNIGVAIAFVVVLLGWAVNKIFRRDLLL